MTKWILVVDDDDEIREVVQASLEEFGGWQTITAASGHEALQIAKTDVLDAILLDISMPGMDGFEVCSALQAEPRTQNIPVIVLTAKALLSDRQQFLDLDIAGVIIKPFDPINIWRQVAQILGWSE
ncbi:two-component system response regulator [[Phormidium ambiguum] IAM M-71]|uniref:Two-component system response regulator n=1 Tax=[Phormidium ambiguum] IAM M-71 TaxID=454136 RepID=A0A1U7IL73_9CYAN|nr:response regulator [Phormidium ambiguum]OKH37923.1 two-component system response regulator [Phormidium ambiguum IAM M-71]